jgi:glycosyltransferase involved in cell wall biosynthesis
MRVLHLVDSSSFNPILADISKHTDKSRVKLFAATLAASGVLHEGLAEEGVQTFALGCEGCAQYPRAIARMASILRRHRIDVMHAHLVQSSLVGLTAACLARTPARVMTRHHSDAALLSGSRAALKADRLTARLANEVIAVSEATRKALIEIDGVDERKITVVPNGFDWERIQPKPGAREAIREEFGLGENPVLCTVGRLDKLKGHDVLLRAFAKAAGAEARLIIVGSGPQQESLETLARELGVRERVVFAGYRADVYDVVAASDLVAHPSLSEAHSLTLVEALHLGRGVVATDVGAAREVIIPGETGWLVAANDEAALGEAIREALSNPDNARARALAGQRMVHSMYPVEKMIAGYEAVYARHLPRA